MNITPEAIVAGLQAALKKGCRAPRLIYVPELLDVLVPPSSPETAGRFADRMERGFKAEEMIARACEHYGPPSADSLKALLGLTGDHSAPLYQRRRVAGAHHGVRPRTFAKNYEDDLLMDLAAELWRRLSRSG